MSKRNRNAVDTYSFACPTCNARMGEWCRGRGPDEPHAARQAKVPFRPTPGQKKVQSVRAIPSAIETNRRRH